MPHGHEADGKWFSVLYRSVKDWRGPLSENVYHSESQQAANWRAPNSLSYSQVRLGRQDHHGPRDEMEGITLTVQRYEPGHGSHDKKNDLNPEPQNMTESIRRGLFYVIHNDDVDNRFGLYQLQTQLVLYGGKQVRGHVRVRFRHQAGRGHQVG